MDAPTIIALIVVSLVVIGLVAIMIINKKKGKTSCSCGCQSCAFKDSCHTDKAPKEQKKEQETEPDVVASSSCCSTPKK